MEKNSPVTLPMFKAQKSATPTPLRNSLGFGLQILFLVSAGLFLLMGQSPAWKSLVDNVAINFLSVTLEALPFMLLGTLAGGIIEVFIPTLWIDRIFRKNRTRGIFLAGTIGMIFPTCECAIVPVVRRLLGKGVPFPAAITFLLAGPIVNPIVAWSTATAYTFSWKIVIIRLACGYVIAVLVGMLLGRFFNRENGVLPGLHTTADASCLCLQQEDTPAPLRRRLGHALDHAGQDFFTVGRYLVIGTFIAAVLRSSVSLSTFEGLLASPWLAILLMMACAILLNLCSEADAFIAASFRWSLPDSAQMAFMVLGPMFDIKLLLMYLSVFRKRVIVALSLSTIFSVLLLMLVLQYFFPNIFI
jgi:hypothetical protein